MIIGFENFIHKVHLDQKEKECWDWCLKTLDKTAFMKSFSNIDNNIYYTFYFINEEDFLAFKLKFGL